MKLHLLSFGIMLIAATCASGYEKILIHVLEQLRQCKFDEETPLVGGPAVGEAGTPHEFYLLFPYVDRLASDEDLLAMLRDKSPVVRIMAAKCILKKKDQADDLKKAVVALRKDQAKVAVMPFGCMVFRGTVSQVLSELQKNPDYLGDLEEGSSDSIEPTTPFVRPRG